MKRATKLLLLAIIIVVGYATYYCWISFPIATGYGAKVLCSSIFVSEREERNILREDLDFFPVNLVKFKIDRQQQTVSATLFGLAHQRAIYRKGLGATLVNDIAEKSLRDQRFILPAGVKRTTNLWPFGDSLPGITSSNIDTTIIGSFVDQIFLATDSPSINRTRALIVLYDGNIIAERYAPGFNMHTKLAGWSMTKSITGALVGLLVRDRKINVEARAPVKAWSEKKDRRSGISTKNLLQQTSGLLWEEEYDRSSHANRMLFQKGDAGTFAASQDMLHPAGSSFHYSSGNSNILSSIIRSVVGDAEYHQYPYRELFHRIGMYNTVLEPDASGTFVGSSFCYATARDWARFGLLYQQDGVFNGLRILPEGWVKSTITPADAAEEGEYGFQWWLNAGNKNDSTKRSYPKLPRDMFYADGYEGQNIFIVPSKKIVVVRLGLTRNKHWGEEKFISNVISAIKD